MSWAGGILFLIIIGTGLFIFIRRDSRTRYDRDPAWRSKPPQSAPPAGANSGSSVAGTSYRSAADEQRSEAKNSIDVSRLHSPSDFVQILCQDATYWFTPVDLGVISRPKDFSEVGDHVYGPAPYYERMHQRVCELGGKLLHLGILHDIIVNTIGADQGVVVRNLARTGPDRHLTEQENQRWLELTIRLFGDQRVSDGSRAILVKRIKDARNIYYSENFHMKYDQRVDQLLDEASRHGSREVRLAVQPRS